MPSTLFVILFIIWLPVVALATNDSHLRGIGTIHPQTAVPSRLLIEYDAQMKADGERCRIPGYALRACDQAPTNNESEDAHVYRVAHEAVESNRHQLLWRVPGR